MKLESQVCSLELAKKLDELHKARGIEGESYFVWLEASDGARLLKNPVLDTYKYFARFPAFTTAELGEMLPSHVSINGNFSLTYFSAFSLWVMLLVFILCN